MAASKLLSSIRGQYQGRSAAVRSSAAVRRRRRQVTAKSLPVRGPVAVTPKPSLLGNLRRMYARRGSEACKAQHSPPRLLAKDIDNDAASDDETVSVCSRNEEISLDDELPTRFVHFCSRVEILEIPNRHAYPAKQKAKIWRTRKQIKKAATRNQFEFAYDGRDWETVALENDFVLLDGKLVHPAHAEG